MRVERALLVRPLKMHHYCARDQDETSKTSDDVTLP